MYLVRCSVERELELGDKAGNKSLALLLAFILLLLFWFYYSEVQMAHLSSVYNIGEAYVTQT